MKPYNSEDPHRNSLELMMNLSTIRPVSDAESMYSDLCVTDTSYQSMAGPLNSTEWCPNISTTSMSQTSADASVTCSNGSEQLASDYSEQYTGPSENSSSFLGANTLNQLMGHLTLNSEDATQMCDSQECSSCIYQQQHREQQQIDSRLYPSPEMSEHSEEYSSDYDSGSDDAEEQIYMNTLMLHGLSMHVNTSFTFCEDPDSPDTLSCPPNSTNGSLKSDEFDIDVDNSKTPTNKYHLELSEDSVYERYLEQHLSPRFVHDRTRMATPAQSQGDSKDTTSMVMQRHSNQPGESYSQRREQYYKRKSIYQQLMMKQLQQLQGGACTSSCANNHTNTHAHTALYETMQPERTYQEIADYSFKPIHPVPTTQQRPSPDGKEATPKQTSRSSLYAKVARDRCSPSSEEPSYLYPQKHEHFYREHSQRGCQKRFHECRALSQPIHRTNNDLVLLSDPADLRRLSLPQEAIVSNRCQAHRCTIQEQHILPRFSQQNMDQLHGNQARTTCNKTVRYQHQASLAAKSHNSFIDSSAFDQTIISSVSTQKGCSMPLACVPILFRKKRDVFKKMNKMNKKKASEARRQSKQSQEELLSAQEFHSRRTSRCSVEDSTFETLATL